MEEQINALIPVSEDIVRVLEKHECKNGFALMALSRVLKAVLDMSPSEIRGELEQAVINFIKKD